MLEAEEDLPHNQIHHQMDSTARTRSSTLPHPVVVVESIAAACFSCEITMGLPEVERCCFCVSLETGCVVLAVISTVMCLGGIGLGSWQLPNHHQHRNEDNIVLMSLAMFCMLSAVCNIGALFGVFLKRSNYIQLALLSNVVFTVCILLVAVVGCLFSAALRPLLRQPALLVLCVILMAAGTAYAFYYLTILKSVYNKMKVLYGDSAIPV